MIRLAWKTDSGSRREINEDSIIVDEKLNIFLLADGMGGHTAGQMASSMAVQEAYTFLRNNICNINRTQIHSILEAAMLKAHDCIKRRVASGMRLEEMGTTLLEVVVRGETAFVCNIGDSRAYRMNSSLKQITKDHAVIDHFIGEILMAGEMNGSRYRMLTQAVGASENIVPDSFTVELEKSDILLLCSDGLTDLLSDRSIEDIVRRYRYDLCETVHNLVEYAKRKGAFDNISVILLEIL